MPTYERRRTFVKAQQWLDESTHDAAAFIHPLMLEVTDHGRPLATARFWCEKSNAYVNLHDGDYIIAEADGSGFYPCAKDVFFASYDLPAEKQSAP